MGDRRLFVVPFTKSNAYQIPLGHGSRHERASVAQDAAESGPDGDGDAEQLPAANPTHVTTKRSSRVPMHFHNALGHVGERRIHDSNLVIDGVNVATLEHDPSSCVGCRLGNSGRDISKHRKWRSVERHGPPSLTFTHFGQQVDQTFARALRLPSLTSSCQC